jgi:hypothetical protein
VKPVKISKRKHTSCDSLGKSFEEIRLGKEKEEVGHDESERRGMKDHVDKSRGIVIILPILWLKSNPQSL